MIPQTDPSWLPARVGKLTASRMGDAMDFRKDGKPGAARSKLLRELLAERLECVAKDHYVSAAMQWGLDYEEAAADAYEAHTGNLLMPGGFFDHPYIANLGATPDRLVGREGLIEIKCPITETYIDWRMAGIVPEQHRPQMALQLICTRRQWCDFVAYDPRLPPGLRLFVRRFTPPAQYLATVEQAAVDFLKDLDRMFELFTARQDNDPLNNPNDPRAVADSEAQQMAERTGTGEPGPDTAIAQPAPSARAANKKRSDPTTP
jgi:putative phage-type endonuclease